MYLALSLCLVSTLAIPACPLFQEPVEAPPLLVAAPPPPPPAGWYELKEASENSQSTRKNWHEWFLHVYPVHTEFRWQNYGWTQQFGEGVQLAAQQRKPLVLWLGKGHPLGATSPAGRALREAWIGPKVTQEMNKLFPVADDISRLLASSDPEADFLHSVLAQSEQNTDWAEGGVFVLSPSGQLLSACRQDAAQEDLAATLAQGLAAWQNLEADARVTVSSEQLAAPSRLERLFPHDGLALEVFLRDLPAAKGEIPVVGDLPRSESWSRDYLWFSREEMLQFLPPDSLRSRELHEVPAPLAQRLARLALHDQLHGLGTPYDEADVLQVSITLSMQASTKTHRHFLIQGEATLINERVEKPYGIKVQLWGRAQWSRQGEHFSLLEILGEGTRFGHEPGSGRPEKSEGIAPRALGFALRRVLAKDGWHQVPPASFSQYPEGWPVGE